LLVLWHLRFGILLQVLFLGSGDLRNALFMASHSTEAYHELDIHMSDKCDIATARNFLIAHVILSNSFEPSNPIDLEYLWDLWYGCKWTETTRTRFVKDVKQLMANQLANASVISHGKNFSGKLAKILKSWLNTASNMTVTVMNQILDQRKT